MAAIAVKTPTVAGIDVTADWVAASAPGDTMVNDGKTFLHVKTVATPCTVTINSQQPCSQGFDHDLSTVIAANKEYALGPFPVDRFNDPATGTIGITYSAVTAVTVRADRANV